MSRVNDIETRLWSMANALRGTMDASEYKNYILPFMFYRYLSKNQDEHLSKNGLEDYYIVDEEEREEYIEDIVSSLKYAIKPEYTWQSLVSKIENHKIKASDFQDMFEDFRKNSMRSNDPAFADVFADVNLGDTRLGSNTSERANALNDIVLMINEFDFKDESGHDVLGDVYEYLIGQFAANAGKKGGEFYTPHEVSRILSKLVTIDAVDSTNQFLVYDFAMGSGSLLLTVQKELPYGNRVGSVEFYGQELITTTYNLARMNLMMHGVSAKNMRLSRADTLDADWPFVRNDGIQTPMKFDAVANPPYSQKWNISDIDRNKDSRFKDYGVAPASKADYAFILHGLYHLDAKGTMAIVLPHGVLFRGASEEKIRKKIIEENLLDAVIGVPPNLFYGTGIPTCILVFKGREKRGETTDILFIDASKEFVKDRNKNKLTDENINKIIDAYRNRVDVEKYAHVATLDEIKDNDYNLNIPRYVDTFEDEIVTPLPELARELKEVRQEISAISVNLLNMLKDLEGKTSEADEELKELSVFHVTWHNHSEAFDMSFDSYRSVLPLV